MEALGVGGLKMGGLRVDGLRLGGLKAGGLKKSGLGVDGLDVLMAGLESLGSVVVGVVVGRWVGLEVGGVSE